MAKYSGEIITGLYKSKIIKHLIPISPPPHIIHTSLLKERSAQLPPCPKTGITKHHQTKNNNPQQSKNNKNLVQNKAPNTNTNPKKKTSLPLFSIQ